MSTDTYMIIRFYKAHNRNPIIKRRLTLEEAQAHCRRDDTRCEGVWFDGYDKENRK